MSEPASPNDAATTGREAFRRRGFRIFGLGLQDFIKYFFGGNASLAIVFIILICYFLGREGLLFFPAHHEGLQAYRQGGQEYVDFMSAEIDAHTNFYSSANIAYFAEVNESSKVEDRLISGVRVVIANVEEYSRKSWNLLKRKLEEETSLSAAVDKAAPDSPERVAAVSALEGRRKEIADLRVKLREEVEYALTLPDVWSITGVSEGFSEEERKKLHEVVLFSASPDAKEEHPYLLELKAASKAKKAEAAVKLADFKNTLKGIQDSIRPLRTLHSDLKKVASGNRAVITSFSTAPERLEALRAGAEKAADPAEKARLLAQANEVVITEPDYAALNVPIYATVGKHGELAAALQTAMVPLYESLPKDVATESARENLKRSEVLYARFEKAVKDSTEGVIKWRHDEPVSWPGSVTAFIFGKQWITNSSWHDFYGLLPILLGSLLISLIALTVAVPFSVAAAIYVNQLASHHEQNFIKPAIEFIGAIPSVVMGFFGILVFGETLREISQIEWLSWVPGFPMAERLTILNAGLLLAFMAIPTIFTLTEDALENVPAAFSENSLAMGATKLQTVFRVVVPTAVSGLIAAILLGFGRIIGETMVVLLVAGNKIKIPDFSEGLGVVAQPTHTMTGIIAQELGEVDSGSIHWGALFIVGMVLFVIALAVNFTAQQVLKRLQKI